MSVSSTNSGRSVCAFCKYPVEDNKGHGHCALAYELASKGYINKKTTRPASSLATRAKSIPSRIVSAPSRVFSIFRRR